MVTVFWTGSDRFGQVRTGVKYYFSQTVSRTLSKFGLPPKPACSFQLADLKYAIFSSTGCKNKNLPRLKLFLSMVFKHGLLEGSTSEQM